jgi:hypothetical protein
MPGEQSSDKIEILVYHVVCRGEAGIKDTDNPAQV